MMTLSNYLRSAGAVLWVGLLVGCGSTPQTHFYTLQAPLPADAGSSLAAATQPGIVLGPVTLPEMVDRPQLVVRTANNGVGISDLHRWAESLKRDVAHVLAAGLSRELGNPRVTVHGQDGAVDPDIRIAVDILRFESEPGVGVTIEALWTAHRKGVKPVSGRSVVRESVAGSGYDLLVAAHGRALEKVARDIAAAIRS